MGCKEQMNNEYFKFFVFYIFFSKSDVFTSLFNLCEEENRIYLYCF